MAMNLPVSISLVLMLLSHPSLARGFGDECNEYTTDIEVAVHRWWDDLPKWRLWRAQLYAESRCDPEAVSPVGAKGIAQFMEPTWQEWSKRIGADPYTSPHVAKWAIPAGAAYMRSLRKSWSGRERPVMAQHSLAMASYNGGIGSIITAQKHCDDALLWESIAPCLEQSTGKKNAKETVDYVARIYRYFNLMEASND